MDVKWFFRDDPQPFFQWLPGRPPQTIGDLFRHRLDLKYEVPGSDIYRRHRAIKIMRPTTELSGTYRCKVSSFIDEDFMQKKMTVYCKLYSYNYNYSDKNCQNNFYTNLDQYCKTFSCSNWNYCKMFVFKFRNFSGLNLGCKLTDLQIITQ